MGLAKYNFTSTDIIIFKHYGLYHIAIEIAHEDICIESYSRPTFQGVLTALQESIIEGEDEYGKIGIREEAILGIYSSLEQLKDHFIKDMEEAQLSA